MPRIQTVIAVVGLIVVIAVVIQAASKHWIPFAALLIFVAIMFTVPTLAARVRRKKHTR